MANAPNPLDMYSVICDPHLELFVSLCTAPPTSQWLSSQTVQELLDPGYQAVRVDTGGDYIEAESFRVDPYMGTNDTFRLVDWGSVMFDGRKLNNTYTVTGVAVYAKYDDLGNIFFGYYPLPENLSIGPFTGPLVVAGSCGAWSIRGNTTINFQ